MENEKQLAIHQKVRRLDCLKRGKAKSGASAIEVARPATQVEGVMTST
jgi:hypothetical protein